MTTADPLQDWSPARFWLFRWYLRMLFWRRFDKVMISRDGLPIVPPGRPLVVYCNHPSWWDPALFMMVANRLFPGRPGFGPMDSKSLDRYRLFRRLGVFGIDTESRQGAVDFLRVCLKAFANPKAMLFITAQGHFVDGRERPVRLQGGIAHLARRIPNVLLVPMAIEYAFWNESRPVALMRFGKAFDGDGTTPVEAWTGRLEAALCETMDSLAADSMTRERSRFVTAFEGAAGGDGLYDTIRRMSAWLVGRPFDSRHDRSEPVERDGR